MMSMTSPYLFILFLFHIFDFFLKSILVLIQTIECYQAQWNVLNLQFWAFTILSYPIILYLLTLLLLQLDANLNEGEPYNRLAQ